MATMQDNLANSASIVFVQEDEQINTPPRSCTNELYMKIRKESARW
jgi:hypothetical protein